jgi:hypothetical protein
MIITDEELLERIEAFIRRTEMPPTRFGREAMREASFIESLRNGRSLSLRNANRVLRFMAEHEDAASQHHPSTRQTGDASTILAEQRS